MTIGITSPRWENGSDYHWPIEGLASGTPEHPWGGRDCVFYGSGRDALRGLVAHGIACANWVRMWLPAYICPDVVDALVSTGIELRFYRDSPLELPAWPLEIDETDAVLVMNYFGLRSPVDTSCLMAAGAKVIENHTHDPWSSWALSSSADYCLVALRKTLPVADGGVVWSPRNRSMPVEPCLTEIHRQAVDDKRRAMAMKSEYLAGRVAEKGTYRVLYESGERGIAEGMVSGISPASRALIETFAADSWRDRRRTNFEQLSQELAGVAGLRVLVPARGCVPFSTVVVADSRQMRDSLREVLIGQHIYPAVLWDLGKDSHAEAPEDLVDLSRRILSIHCDARYGGRDIRVVSGAIRRACP